MVFPERINSVEQLEVTSRRVFVHVDFDVPLGADGKIIDYTKLRETYVLRQTN